MSKRHPYSLVGIDGNAFSVMAYTINAMKQCGYSNDAITCYKQEAIAGNYDDLLSLSITMVDNCNKLSGYDHPLQQLFKNFDDLDYVDYPHVGTQNSREQLINEDIDWSELDDEDPPLTDTFSSRENVKLSTDYQRLYNTIFNTIYNILDNEIADKNIFTKEMVKNALIGTSGIINDTWFWEDIEEQTEQNILMYMNEAVSMESHIKNKLESKLYNVLIWLLEDGVKFSKYDVYHVFSSIALSNALYDKFDIYIKESE